MECGPNPDAGAMEQWPGSPPESPGFRFS